MSQKTELFLEGPDPRLCSRRDGRRHQHCRRHHFDGEGAPDEGNVDDLLDEHCDELNVEALQAIAEEENEEAQKEVLSEEKDEGKGPVPTSAVKEFLQKWDDVQKFALEWHPNKIEVSRSVDLFNDKTICHFRNLLKKRSKQSTLDGFFQSRPSKKIRSSAEERPSS